MSYKFLSRMFCKKSIWYIVRRLTRVAYRVKGIGLGRLSEAVRRYAARVAPEEPLIIEDFCGDLKFRCYLREHMGGQIFFRGSYSEDQLALLSTLLSSDATFIDVGANQGEFTVFGGSLVRCGKVIAIEPVAEYRQRLEENIRLNDLSNVQVIPFALGDTEGEIPIYESSEPFDDGTHHDGLATLFASEKRAKPREMVRVRRLDEVLAELDVHRIDIIKLDIEGAEWAALRGGVDTLVRYRPILFVEIGKETCLAAGYKPQDFVQWIIQQGYRVEKIGPGGISHPMSLKQLDDFQNIVAYPLK